MEVPLTPMEFARRARRLYADREAVVDGDYRFTYAQFFERCDRWSAALQEMGIQQGDRVATIAPNTHSHLEAYYAITQIGAVIVPINYRLTPADFAYIINHSGCRIICVHSDYLDAIDSVRDQLPDVEQFVALEGNKEGWLNYEATLASHAPQFDAPNINEGDLLSINYTSGTTARPKGVMITHRNAYMNIMGTLAHHPMSPQGQLFVDIAHVPRQWLDLRLDCNGAWWLACLPAPSRGPGHLPTHDRGKCHHVLCSTNGTDWHCQCPGRVA